MPDPVRLPHAAHPDPTVSPLPVPDPDDCERCGRPGAESVEIAGERHWLCAPCDDQTRRPGDPVDTTPRAICERLARHTDMPPEWLWMPREHRLAALADRAVDQLQDARRDLGLLRAERDAERSQRDAARVALSLAEERLEQEKASWAQAYTRAEKAERDRDRLRRQGQRLEDENDRLRALLTRVAREWGEKCGECDDEGKIVAYFTERPDQPVTSKTPIFDDRVDCLEAECFEGWRIPDEIGPETAGGAS